MNKPKVFVTRQIPGPGLNLLRDQCEVDVWEEELPPEKGMLLQRVRGANGLLTMLSDRIDAEVMDAAGESLRVVANYAVGYDNIDLAAAAARGVRVGNTPGILTDATADLAFALMMSAGRRIAEGSRYVRDGRWRTWGPSLLLGVDFQGATLGILGYGRIGRAMARRARGFDMRILFTHPGRTVEPEGDARQVDLDTLLRESDFLSLHVPLTPRTRNLIDGAALARMKPTAVLINTARGAVVDQLALADALREGRLFAAGLDVSDPEPLPMEHPLHALDNCLIVPHIGSASRTTRGKMGVMAAENILAGLRGEELPNPVG